MADDAEAEEAVALRYSVYNYTRRSYDYYEGPGPGGTHAGSPAAGRTAPDGIGTGPDQASWRLPAGARKIGAGDLPVGRIASLDGADELGGHKDLIVLAAIAYLGWRMLR